MTIRHRSVRRSRLAGISLMLAAGIVVSSASLTEAGAPAPADRASDSSVVSVVGLREGAQGPGVVAVQQTLINFGYVIRSGADGTFGPSTTAVLRVFQTQNGLNPTGVVTENTAKYLGLSAGAAAPAAPATPAAPVDSTSVVGLRRGATGEAVRQLQTTIMSPAVGLFLRTGADGTFGASTERAVKLVQRVNGLPETGVVDARTAQVLGLSGSASSPTTPAPAGTVVQFGNRGAAVKRIQQLLIQAGVNVRGGADGIFGSGTRAAVQAFQTAKGLPVTGVVDAATDAALVATGTPTAPTTPATSTYIGLRLGSTGPAVTAVQKAIMATGLVVRGGADGVFGQGTHNALVVYQRTNGLSATGVVDEATARLMGLQGGGAAAPTGGGNTAAGFPIYDEQGSRVVALQQALINAGIPVPGGADGRFGSGTAGAVMKLQKARGLRVTGKVDAATAAALGLSALPTPSPTPVPTVSMQAKPIAPGRCWYVDTWQANRGGGRVHLGVDIGGAEGTPLQAVVTGRVIRIYRDQPGSLSGNGIKIATADGTYFFYAHLSSFAAGIDVGVPVTAGQVIGYMGRTGNAGISHLHFEVHPGGGAAVNPFPYVQSVGAC